MVGILNNPISSNSKTLLFKSGKAWGERVSHGCDFAVMRLPADVLSEPAISKAVTHLGHALHYTGVGHV